MSKKPYSMHISRNRFESILGGEWKVDPEQPDRRSNGTMATYKDFSEEIPERRVCFLKIGKKVYEAPNWTSLLKKAGKA